MINPRPGSAARASHRGEHTEPDDVSVTRWAQEEEPLEEVAD